MVSASTCVVNVIKINEIVGLIERKQDIPSRIQTDSQPKLLFSVNNVEYGLDCDRRILISGTESLSLKKPA